MLCQGWAFQRFRRWRCLALVAYFAALPAIPVAGQQSGGKATEPGQIQKRIIPPEAPRAPVEPIMPPEPVTPQDRSGLAASFVLVGVEIAGATVYRPEDLLFVYEDLLGREILVQDVESILAAITKIYRDDGYILSRATAPPQTIESGILRIEVVEGFVIRVAFSGAQPGGDALLQAFADKIKANRPLRLADLERYLLLMADAPGLGVTPTLEALDEAKGEFLLRLALKHDPADGFVNLDNRGTTPVGPLQLFAGVNLNSALGLLERTRISVFTVPNAPEELLYGQIHHEHILSAEGTRAWFAASRSMVDTGEAGTASKENSFDTRFTLGLSHPLIRSRGFNFSARLRFDAIDSDKNSPTAGNDFDDRLRVARLGGVLSFTDQIGGTTWVTGELSKGFEVLHATERNATLVSRTGGRSDFFKLKLDVVRRQKLAKHISLRFTASAQKSPHILLSSEEFSVGGRRFGRAYNPSEISGGDGAAGALELRLNSPYKPEVMRRIQLYGYYDIGAVWGEGVTHQSLASAGGGLRLGLPFNIDADLELAWPLTRAITPGEAGNRGARVFFKLLKRF